MQELGETTMVAFVIGFLILTAYWSLRGIIQLFQRHNSIIVMFYLGFLFPIAYFHALLLGIFGESKAARLAAEIEAEAARQLAIEQAKADKIKRSLADH